MRSLPWLVNMTAPSTPTPDAIPEATPGDALEAPASSQGRFHFQEGLRARAARGVLINSAFQVGFAGLTLLQRFAVAAFLTATEFGIWGLVLTTLVTLSWLKQVGISDKYVQQDEPDQETAFQKAFALHFAYTMLFFVFLVGVVPLYALIYGRFEIVFPSLVLALALFGGAFHAPLWIPYRQMRFVRQRVLEAVNPVVSTVVMVALAATGAGYWSLVIGILAGTYAGAVVAVLSSPYRLGFRVDRGALREYFRFSWPLLISSGSGLLAVQATMILGNYTVGLAGVGALALTSSLILFAQRVDSIISRTIYPAVCAVKDRLELLAETFIKSNRLALMWGLPFGVGLLLFAPDLVEFVLGERWRPAEGLMQALGLIIGIRQLGFNWNVFFRAVGNTRPLAVSAVIVLVVFLLVAVPGMVLLGLTGYVIAASAAMVTELAVRAYYLTRMFKGFSPIAHLTRAIAPSLPAAAAVLVARALYTGDRAFEVALVEFTLYVIVTAIATIGFERRLLAEILGYLRGAPRTVAGTAPEQREALARSG